jgi:HEAT repeat protein
LESDLEEIMTDQFFPPQRISHHPNFVRYPQQVTLLQQAVNDDIQAVEIVLTYLGSSIHDLRVIMQAAMHDWHHTRLWQHLLRCLALHRWNGEGDCPRLEESKALQRIDRSITEVLIVDESAAERREKETVLRLGLGSPEPQVRYASACLLGLRNQPEAIPFLTEVINYGERRWKLLAIVALEILDREECSFPLILALADPDQAVHQAASRAIPKLGRKAIPGLLPAISHPDSHVRWHAARALGVIGDKRAVRELAEGLADDNEVVRWASANALAVLEKESIPAILEVIGSHTMNEAFRQAVFHALHAMKEETRSKLQPLIETLSSPGTSAVAPAVAARLLIECWDN